MCIDIVVRSMLSSVDVARYRPWFMVCWTDQSEGVWLAAGNMEPVYSTVAIFCTVQLQIICTDNCLSLSNLVTSFLLPFALLKLLAHVYEPICALSKSNDLCWQAMLLKAIGQKTRIWFSLLCSEELECTAKTWYKLVLYNTNVYFLEEPEYDEKIGCV